MSRVSVVVVNYNGRHFLDDLFDSLARQRRQADEVIMIDNASVDESVEHTRERYPWVKVVPLERNVGFAEGNNVGVAHATGEYIALLNNDTVVDERWLDELVRALDVDERNGAVVSKIYVDTPEPTLECAGADFNNLGFCWGRGTNQPDRGQFDIPCEVPAATACAMALRRDALGERALFDSQLFMYYEEFEFSLRLRGRGYRIVYVPTAVVWHKRSGSVKAASKRPLLFQQFYGNRNRVKILAKYYPLPVLVRGLPLILLSVAYWDFVLLRYGGPTCLARAVVQQCSYAVQGLAERLRGEAVPAEASFAWITHHDLRALLCLKSNLGSYAK